MERKKISNGKIKTQDYFRMVEISDFDPDSSEKKKVFENRVENFCKKYNFFGYDDGKDSSKNKNFREKISDDLNNCSSESINSSEYFITNSAKKGN